MAYSNLAFASERREDRDDVHHHTQLQAADGRSIPGLIVNISPSGLMVRCDADLQPGTRLTFRLPQAPRLAAEVRWALGGRIGCEFERAIPPSDYYPLLGRLTR